ncbi:hypothetical protein NB689_002960 [Xanthomonas sacchari]|nr:hypothetical protein [Xanthomonas sacchari]
MRNCSSLLGNTWSSMPCTRPIAALSGVRSSCASIALDSRTSRSYRCSCALMPLKSVASPASSSGAPGTTRARAAKSPSLIRRAASATLENCRDNGREASRPQITITGIDASTMPASSHQSRLASPGRKSATS